MAKSVRVQVNRAAVVALLQSPEVAAELESRGDRIAAAAGPGHEVRVTRNRDRAVVFVTTATTDARRGEADDGTLTRAIDAGR